MPRLIGQLKGPVRITGEQMVQLVRNQIVADMPSITLPVPRVSALDRIRRVLHWTIPFGALFAVGFFVIGFMLHPNRSALVHSLGYGLVLLALLIVVLGLRHAAIRVARAQRQLLGRRAGAPRQRFAAAAGRLGGRPRCGRIDVVASAQGCCGGDDDGTRRSAPTAIAKSVAGTDRELGREFGDELGEHVGVVHRVGVGVHHRDQPLLVETRRQQYAAVDAMHPLREREVEVGGLVVAVVLDLRRRPRDATLRTELHRVCRQIGLVDGLSDTLASTRPLRSIVACVASGVHTSPSTAFDAAMHSGLPL